VAIRMALLARVLGGLEVAAPVKKAAKKARVA